MAKAGKAFEKGATLAAKDRNLNNRNKQRKRNRGNGGLIDLMGDGDKDGGLSEDMNRSGELISDNEKADEDMDEEDEDDDGEYDQDDSDN